MTGRILVASNGFGEDHIACKVLDALRDLRPDVEITAWPMVGQGQAYLDRGIFTDGPSNTLPSEGFGTVSLGNFMRDLRAGFIGTYLRQLSHARGLRGRFDVMLGVGDAIPLIAGQAARGPLVFVSTAKSSYYGPKTDHDALDRALMRRAAQVFVRDDLTAQTLAAKGAKGAVAANPMMDGLEASGTPLVGEGEIGIAMLPGSRRDAAQNAADLLAGAAMAAIERADASRLRFLFALAGGTRAEDVAAEGWTRDGSILRHGTGAKAHLLTGRFSDVLGASALAVGMAGTANEQAVGLGLPLVNLPGRGNQGEAFWRMKTRYFGPSALPARREAVAIGNAISVLLDDEDRRAEMGREGRARMGPPGGSEIIAKALLPYLEAP